MHWAARPYTVTIVRAATDRACLWNYHTWHSLSALLEPALPLCLGPEAVRVQQHPLRTRVQGRGIPFRQLRLNDASNQKWTHGSPLTADPDWYFFNFECWSPSWTVCAKGQSTHTPDLFLGFQSELPGIIPAEPPRTQDLVLAVAEDRAGELASHTTAFLDALVAAITPARVTQVSKPWGRAFGPAVVNALPDWFRQRSY